MYEMIKKFFDFCDKKNRKKLYKSVILGVFDAILGAMKIPAAFVAFGAVINQTINKKTILLVIGLMLLSTVGKTIVNRFAHMLQTEGGYDTCASKRIQIAEHLRYLPMGYFNDTSFQKQL
jgi:ATP-binding cassette subfamily B protein